MRIFVTGATGYVGSAIAAALKRRGHDVVGLARSPQAIEKLQRHDIHPVAGSLTDANVLREMTHDADAVVHAAAEMSPNGPAVDAAGLDGILSGIDTDHEAFVYTSGCWVYGDTGGRTVDESAPLDPTPLVAWRPAHEQRVLDAARHRLRAIVIRPGMVYGGEGGIIGGMLAEARAGGLRIVGDGRNHWTCVEVHDLADLYVRAVEEAPAGSIYNASGPGTPTYGEIARAALAAAGHKGEPQTIPLDEARRAMGAYADALALDQQIASERAKRDLGWQPAAASVIETLQLAGSA